MKIKEIFEKPIDRKIEEVIKVTQIEESVVHDEISEYIVTDTIKDYFVDILKAYSEAPSSPHEGIGIWISGFFGSGKSSFAKILGYILEGRNILNEDVRNLFKNQANDKKIADFLDYVKAKIPTKSIIFDVSMDRGVRSGADRITEIMYKVLLRELDYAEDFDIAKLEQDLEEENKLNSFNELYEKEYSKPWTKGRKRASAINEASRILHLMDDRTYNQPDSWSRSLVRSGDTIGRADITPNKFAELAFELMGRRGKNKGLVFVVDEVGQYVSRSVDKMLDLQAIIQAIGVESRNRVSNKRASAPTWMIVTSQEKLNEVVSALDDRRIELARLKDRFPIEIDLAPADIAEVASKRVLTKKAAIVPQLNKMFQDNQHRLNQCTSLEHTSRTSEIQRDEFINLYPYLPFHIDLCIDIMSGIRLLPGAKRHIGGSNRTIIKQAQQMLINPRVKLADEEVGMIVTFDKVYDLIEDNLSSEKQRDIISIKERFSDNNIVIKVAKAICLLEFVKDLPRTTKNIAAVLYPNIGAESCLSEVEEAVKNLERAQFIKLSDDGYKLLTVQEKNWDIKRNELSPKPADRNKIRVEIMEGLFGDSKATHINYKGLRTFKITYVLDGKNIGDRGDIEVGLLITDDADEFNACCEEKKRDSRHESNKNKIFWIVSQNEEIHRLIEELYRSDKMIRLHERLASCGQLSAEEHKCFSEEKIRKDKVQRGLRKQLEDAAYSGATIFRGIKKDVSAEGRDFFESVKKLFDSLIPELFPKFTLGAKRLSGKEAQNILTAVNLSGLPPIFYEGKDGYGLISKQGNQFVVNTNAEITQEIMRYIRDKHAYGEKLTGKLLENHFGGIGYGWERDVLRLVLATLFRAGVIEIGYQGKRYKSYDDHVGREAIINNNAFKVSTFTPREKTISLQHIRDACINYEAITGREVDAEENTIEQALKELANGRKEDLLSLNAMTQAHDLPCKEFVNDILKTMTQLQENTSDDCVKF
ncbi:MAG: hypothetical protein SCARUB_03673 [Candidatus Scalindua rubra]|uniref:Probable ATP-binding protein BrxC winged helix-turn-helix domain-containing protein n=1 Tax=Candidatus Scalindua rubra TaxID=1872076 RepID=A0A1E3X6I9_9BACT|nr:MAG: hypothetical protein SCARUB_03673 [Candidatus Scalindua rubra]